MWPIATDRVVWSVFEPIKMPFGTWLGWAR